jgi:adenylate cyclase
LCRIARDTKRPETVFRSIEIFGNGPIMASPDVLKPPGGLSFGDLLDWHLRRGTRPPGSDKQGEPWKKATFAGDVGVSDKQVRNWIANKSLPNDIITIERVLFGRDQEQCTVWRMELRDALKRTRTGSVPTGRVSGELGPVARLATSAAVPGRAPPAWPDSGLRPQSPLPDRPSVAVLPLANLSGDPQQDYFSDGITEDIITELSRFSEVVVIARNSSFQYKGKAVDIRQVGRELGARYVLEGSVRRSGGRIRIVAQLIDAGTGTHRWAERYDRELHDAFAVQDEVARTIVALLAAHVKRAEIERAQLKPPAAWEAYEYYLRGADAFFLHYSRRTKGSLYEARRLLEQCQAIDPGYARAAAMLSWTHAHAYTNPLDGDYLSPAALDRALKLAQMAVHLDARLPQARAQLGYVLLYKRRHDDAVAEFERAFALNPNFIDYRFAVALMFAGEPARAIEVLEASIRLDPFQPSQALGHTSVANYMLKRYGEAVRLMRECASRLPDLQWPHLSLAAAYAQLGQLEEARAEAAEVLRINPGFTIESWKPILIYKNPKDLEHRIDGARKAGLPES